MDAVEWLLIHIAEALLWLGAAAKSLATEALGTLASLLNPILAPILSAVNPICTALGDGVYTVLAPLPAWASLTLLSFVSGLVMLVAFRYTSNQAGLARVKDEIKANLLVLKLYKDELRVTFQAQRRLLWAITRLQGYMLPPVLVMMPPMLLGLAQMGIRHQWRPLRQGEQTLIRMRLAPTRAETAPTPASRFDGTGGSLAIELEPNPGFVVEVDAVPGDGEFMWRIRGGEPGRHTLRFHIGDTMVEKELVVGDSFQRVSAERPDHHWMAMLLHPAERPLPAGGPVESIEILYPGVASWVHGANYWILYFFVVSMMAALVFKPVFKVTF